LNELIDATGSTLGELRGIGPANADRLLGDVGDIARFADRGRFASWNGTALLDASSGDQRRHRLSRAGNRRINRVPALTRSSAWSRLVALIGIMYVIWGGRRFRHIRVGRSSSRSGTALVCEAARTGRVGFTLGLMSQAFVLALVARR